MGVGFESWDSTRAQHQRVAHQAHATLRLLGIDVVAVRNFGLGAATYVGQCIRAPLSPTPVEDESVKHDTSIPDASFGRWLVELWRTDTGERLVDALRGCWLREAAKSVAAEGMGL